jgi:ribosome-associated translation inhibitor RaiA
MQRPLQLTFHGLEPSPAVEARVRELALRLERLYERITSCHVTVQAPHRHHNKGQLYEVRIQLHVPGREIVVNHEGAHDQAHEDVYVAVRDAFEAAARKLEDCDHRRSARG